MAINLEVFGGKVLRLLKQPLRLLEDENSLQQSLGSLEVTEGHLSGVAHLWLFGFISLYACLHQGQSVQTLAQP